MKKKSSRNEEFIIGISFFITPWLLIYLFNKLLGSFGGWALFVWFFMIFTITFFLYYLYRFITELLDFFYNKKKINNYLTYSRSISIESYNLKIKNLSKQVEELKDAVKKTNLIKSEDLIICQVDNQINSDDKQKLIDLFNPTSDDVF